jgi:predicted transcriptional regulator
MASHREAIGREELQVLRSVAEHHPVSVREVADHVAATSGKARTTVLTVMERLRGKGYLVRRKWGGVYGYVDTLPDRMYEASIVKTKLDALLAVDMSDRFGASGRRFCPCLPCNERIG